MRAAALLCLLAAPAYSQGNNNCADRERIVGRLADQYSERFNGGGLQNASQIIEVWVSDEGTWTILLTRSDGRSCIMASGTNWREAWPSDPPGEDG